MNLFDPADVFTLSPAQIRIRDDLNERLARGLLAFETVPCLCGSRDLECIARQDRYGIDQPTAICRSCGLIQASPRLCSEAYQKFYSSDAYRLLYDGDSYQEAWRTRFTAEHGQRIFKVVKEHLEPRSVVEIGAGGGWNLVAFREAGARVAGWDYSEQLTQLGRSQGIDMHRGSVDDALAAGVKYDLVVLNHVLEHFLDPLAALRSLHGLLTPQGRLYVGVPVIDYPFIALLQNAHTYYFTENTLTNCLARAGWTVDRVKREDRMRMDCVARPGQVTPPTLAHEYRDSMTRLRGNRWKVTALQRWYELRAAIGFARRRLAGRLFAG